MACAPILEDMKSSLKAVAAFALISVSPSLVGPAQWVGPLAAQDNDPSAAPVEATDIPAPVAIQPADETPWLYEGSNVPVDREWLFGQMDNGLRYAVRRNGVPPNAVSIRVRVDVGSLHERDSEQGYAHRLELLLFRERT